MTFIRKHNYRLSSICTIPDGDIPISEGLAIETVCADGETWYVICFVKWDECESDCYIDCVGDRLLKVEHGEWELVKELIRAAESLVSIANKE